MSKSNSSKKPVGSMGNRISLARMRAGQKDNIVRISDGNGVVHRLEALNIRDGQKINFKRIVNSDFRKNILRSTAHV
ncbi:MAG: hypothetical protein JRJ14_00350 [Deltaproteobacteria bacterium]|nr:hypothetical protein [Deltaproteobacteria bacterium]